MSLRRLGVILRTFGPTTALHRVLVDQWSTETHMLALSIDVLQLANWQRSGDKHATKPKPIPRPGSGKQAEDQKDNTRDRALGLRARMKAVTDG